MAVASWSRVDVGRIVLQRPAACSATSDAGGQATTTWQPRRIASATPDAVPVSEPSGARTTTRSRLPAQPGRAMPGQATNGTGHHGSSTARSNRESGPAETTAPGRLPRIVSGARRTAAPDPPAPPPRGPAAADRLGGPSYAGLGLAGLPSYPCTRLREVAQRDVGAGKRGGVVEQAVVKHVGPAPQSGLRASSINRIGMSSRTG